MRGLQMETVHTRPGEKKECFRRERGALKKSTGEIMRKPHDRSIVSLLNLSLEHCDFFQALGSGANNTSVERIPKGRERKRKRISFLSFSACRKRDADGALPLSVRWLNAGKHLREDKPLPYLKGKKVACADNPEPYSDSRNGVVGYVFEQAHIPTKCDRVLRDTKTEISRGLIHVFVQRSPPCIGWPKRKKYSGLILVYIFSTKKFFCQNLWITAPN